MDNNNNHVHFIDIISELKPMFILIAIFLAMFSVFAFCYYKLFFPLKYNEEIIAISNKYNVNPALTASVINAESKFNPNIISKKGAVGLMQIMPNTANFISIRTGIQTSEKVDLMDIKINIELGTAYLQYLINKFEDTFTVLCAYNAGEGNVATWLIDSNYSKDGLKLKTTPYSQTNFYAQKVMRNIPFYEKRL